MWPYCKASFYLPEPHLTLAAIGGLLGNACCWKMSAPVNLEPVAMTDPAGNKEYWKTGFPDKIVVS